MKSRLAASVSTLFLGGRRRNACKSASLASKFSAFNGRAQCLSRLCYVGLQSSVRATHTSSVEDEFSELGPPVAENAATPLKLVTEKPDPFLHKTDSGGKASVSRSFPSECRPGIKDMMLNLDESSQTASFKLQEYNDASSLAVDQKSFSKPDSTAIVNQKRTMDSSCSISVENVPSDISFSDLVQAISAFGKVSGACIRRVPDGLDCCDVDFENSESSRRACLAGGITVESVHLPIRPLHSLNIVRILIQGIGKETTDPKIHSICKSIGALEGLARTGKDTVDAFFRVKNDADLQRIVKRLSSTIIDGYYWSAYRLSSNSSSRMITEMKDARSKLGLLMNNRLVALKWQLDSKKVYYEDLQLLHLGILHLEGLPTSSDPLTS